MRKLALAVPFLLAVAACGSDTKSCTTAIAGVQSATGGCSNLRAGSVVTVQMRGNCQTCSLTSPSCAYDATTHHLDTQFQECTEDRSCGTGCLPTQPTFSCQITTPSASGAFTLFYNGPNSSPVQPDLQQIDVTIDPNGSTTCTL